MDEREFTLHVRIIERPPNRHGYNSPIVQTRFSEEEEWEGDDGNVELFDVVYDAEIRGIIPRRSKA